MQALGHGQIAWHPEKHAREGRRRDGLREGALRRPGRAQAGREGARQNDELTIEVDLGLGKYAARDSITCDLTYDYVKINAEYTT